jgi:hypothetical protein
VMFDPAVAIDIIGRLAAAPAAQGPGRPRASALSPARARDQAVEGDARCGRLRRGFRHPQQELTC